MNGEKAEKAGREFAVMVKGKASETNKNDLQFACVHTCMYVCDGF